MKEKLPLISGLIGLYLISAALSWFVFSQTKGSNAMSAGELASIRDKIAELPKTEECPINGAYHTKIERDIWEGRRPLAVMVENHFDARPLSGLSKADVVYEAVAEGGITRFLGVFYCSASSKDFRIAVVRSARVYFIKWAAEYGSNPLFMHWGGANNFGPNGGPKPEGDVDPRVDAYALLNKLDWINGSYGNDLDGSRNFAAPALMRLPNRISDTDAPAEHQPAAFVDLVYTKAAERGWANVDSKGIPWDKNFKNWKFKDDSPDGAPSVSEISFQFWGNWEDYDVKWVYEAENNIYKRFNGGRPFVDYDFNNEQISAKNIVVQFVKEEGPVDNEKHLYYENVGAGEALVFQNGEVYEASWEKDGLLERTRFYDSTGKEIEFVRGKIWVEAVPSGNSVEY
ncbi:DUF3048 domain-containing protein [Candidatus Microgenomates bacterium]|nr:MAG: DUF3048 domain-containing protein [Candidatus Microgenomates bacterium]